MSVETVEARNEGPVSDLDDLLSEEAINDSFSYYTKLRNINPVYWNKRWNGWIVTGYEPVIAGFRDYPRLSSDRFSGPFGAEVVGKGDHPQLLSFLSKFFFFKDPPYHTYARTLVSKAFSPRSVEVLRPRIRELVQFLTSQVRDKERFNFLSDFAFHLPVIVIAEYLGIPPEARYDVKDWSEDLAAVIFVRGNDDDRMARAERAMIKVADFLRPIIRDRTVNPQDDLISSLIVAEEDGKRLSEEEVIANVVLMIFAGHETTMNLMSNGVVAFNKFPDQWQRLYEQPDMVRSATEEVLRFDGPIRGLGRWAKESFELGGQMINERDRVFLFQAAGNRDPKGFERADELDISRWPNKHAAFGQGIHACIGAPLARLEMQEALSYLTAEFEAIPVLDDKLEYHPAMVSRSLKRLDVRMKAR